MQMTANHLCNDDVLCRIAPASSSPESATPTKRWSRAGFESLCDQSCAFVRLELKDTDSKTVESISSSGEHLVSDQGDAGSSPKMCLERHEQQIRIADGLAACS